MPEILDRCLCIRHITQACIKQAEGMLVLAIRGAVKEKYLTIIHIWLKPLDKVLYAPYC